MERRKNVWLAATILLFLLVIALRYSQLSVPGLKLDGGQVLILVLVVAGFFGSLLFGWVNFKTQNLVAQGKYKLAEPGLRKGLSAHQKWAPLSVEYITDLNLLTRVCRETGQFADAEKFARQALDVLDRQEEAMKRLDQQAKTPQATQLGGITIAFGKRYTALRPDALFELAATQYELGKFKEAESSLKDAIKKLDTYIDELRNPPRDTAESDTNWLTKDFVLASVQNANKKNIGEHIFTALRSASKSARLLAKVYAKQDQRDEEEAWSSKATSRCKQGIDFMSQRIALKSDDPQDYLRRSYCYSDLRDYDKAIADIDKVLTLNPPKSLRYVVITNRGECYSRKGKFELALKDSNEAILLRPDSGLALSNRAEVYDHLGKRDLAASDRQKAVATGYQSPRLDLS
jgi:tetratricopeptide (TPR) repeat protein